MLCRLFPFDTLKSINSVKKTSTTITVGTTSWAFTSGLAVLHTCICSYQGIHTAVVGIPSRIFPFATRTTSTQVQQTSGMALALMLTFSGIRAAPLPDLVTSIPGLDGAMSSRVFSGYIDAASPTTKQRFKTHYVFTESQSDPTKGV